MVSFAPAHRFCLALPAAFTQPGDHLLATHSLTRSCGAPEGVAALRPLPPTPAPLHHRPAAAAAAPSHDASASAERLGKGGGIYI